MLKTVGPRYIGVLVLAAVGLISVAYALTQGEIVTAVIGAGCVVLLLVNAGWSSRNQHKGRVSS
jgi:hypothetical protein